MQRIQPIPVDSSPGYLYLDGLDSLLADSCGMAILPAGWQHHQRTMDVSVFILGEQGELDLELEGRPLRIGPGTCCLLPAGCCHRGTRPAGGKVRYFWLHFQTGPAPARLPADEARQILGDPGIAGQRLAGALLLPDSFRPANPGPLREQFQQLLAAWQTGCHTPVAFHCLARLLLIAANQALMDASRQLPRTGPSGLVSLMLGHIHEHLSDPGYSVKALAHGLGYNTDYLNRHFKQLMHQTLKDYLQQQRLELAVRHLRDSNLPLAEVARQAGFATYRNFVRQFALRKGLVPSEFRRRHRQMHISC